MKGLLAIVITAVTTSATPASEELQALPSQYLLLECVCLCILTLSVCSVRGESQVCSCLSQGPAEEARFHPLSLLLNSNAAAF